jgi:uncharacterized protein
MDLPKVSFRGDGATWRNQMAIRETLLSGDVQGTLLKPEAANDLGVVVLAGSSGRVDVTRARLFAAQNATTLALRWFGGEGQVPGICEIPLETFKFATDRLVGEGCKRIAYVGTSKGAEAALLTAIDDARVDFVVAVSPSSVVWANIGVGRDGVEWPQRSSWTRKGAPLPFIAYDVAHQPSQRDGLTSYRSRHEQSLLTYAADFADAAIPVEKARAQILLVAGGDDALWPSDTFAKSISDRLEGAGKKAVSTLHAHGGNDIADLELGTAAWNAILKLLN